LPRFRDIAGFLRRATLPYSTRILGVSPSVVTKAVDAETETKTEAAGFETEAKTETVASETEAKTEAVYLKTEAEAQGSWPILLTVLSSGAVLAQKF